MRIENRPKNSFGRWLRESDRFPCGPKVDKTGVVSVVLCSGVSCSESQGPARGGAMGATGGFNDCNSAERPEQLFYWRWTRDFQW